jgi:hypothetical protein
MVRRLAAALVAAIALLGTIGLPQAASAHGDDETQEAYLLVQQALGHLAHDTGADGIELAMEKVDDALATEDQEGVNVAEVQEGMQALEAGHGQEARALLQDSIADALSSLPPATGYDSGTTVVMSPLPGRTGLSAEDVLLLIGSLAVAGLGIVLAYRFRPRDSVRDLRDRLGADGHARDDDPVTAPKPEGHRDGHL